LNAKLVAAVALALWMQDMLVRQKDYELLFMADGLALTGWAAFKFL